MCVRGRARDLLIKGSERGWRKRRYRKDRADQGDIVIKIRDNSAHRTDGEAERKGK